MKNTFTVIITLFLISNINAQRANFHESMLNEIVTAFNSNYEPSELVNDAKRISTNIKYDIESGDYSFDEIKKMKEVEKKAEAVEKFISVVGIGNVTTMMSMEELNIANELIKADIHTISKNKYCIDIFKIKTKNSFTYLAYNDSPSFNTIDFTWKSKNSLSNEKGNMGIFGNQLRFMFNDKENSKLNDITFTKVTCKEIKY